MHMDHKDPLGVEHDIFSISTFLYTCYLIMVELVLSRGGIDHI